jgi:succinoglycan biosynthesis transport protein ExoP
MIESPDASNGDIASNRLTKGRLAVRLQRVRLLIIRYWWIIALTIMVGLLIQDYRSLQIPTRYVSQSRMMVAGHIILQEGQAYSDAMENFYGTQIVLMKSRQTIVQSMERVSAIHPDVPIDENAEVDAGLELRTTIFDLKVTSVNPQYAKLLLDSIMETYIEAKKGRMAQTTDEAMSNIMEAIAQLEEEIRNDEQKLLDFQKENNVVFIEEQSSSSATYLVGLNNELAQLTRELDLLSMENKETATSAPTPAPGGDATTNPPAATSPDNALSDETNDSIVAQQENIEKLKIQRNQFSVYLKDKHPKMVELTDAINEAQQFLDVLKTRNMATRGTRTQELEMRLKNLQNQIVEANKKSLDLSERLGAYQQLKGKLTREESTYTQLNQSMQNVNLTKDFGQENVQIMEAASKAYPVNSNLPMQMVWGLVGGLLAGIVIIYFVHRLDDRIDSPMEFEENVEFPLIGQIPLVAVDKKTKRAPLLSETDQRHMLLESHRNIRSAILFRSSDVIKPRSLLISSAAPGEGKSTFISNLAIIFAYSGARVLMIDADLRRGVAHNLFNTPLTPGLADYLQQHVAWHDTIQKTHLPNLDIIPRGKVPQQAGDLLLGPLTDVLLQESVAEYDMVLWDSAPVLAADDAANLCSRVDGVLFVARIRHSSIHSVRVALEDLSQRNARIFGVVLNAVEPNQPGYYDRYRYKEDYAPSVEA